MSTSYEPAATTEGHRVLESSRVSEPIPSIPIPSIPIKAAGAGFVRRHAWKLTASALITVGFVFIAVRGGFKFTPERADFVDVRWWTLPAYVALCVSMNYFRAVRWRFLLRGVGDFGIRRILAVSWIGFAAILVMPLRLGEFVRPMMLREKGKASLTAAMSTVVAERIVDGLYLSLVLALALIFVPTIHPLPEYVVGLEGVKVANVRIYGFVMLGIFAAAFVSIAIFYFAPTFATSVLRLTFGRISTQLTDKLVATFEKFSAGLAMFGSKRDAGGFLFESTLYWGANALGMWLLAWGCGVHHADGSAISFGETCALMGMLGVTILIPGPPGLAGVFQAGIYCGTTMYFPASVILAQGRAYAFILYAVQFLWTVLAAGYFLVADRANMSALKRAIATS